MQFFVFMHELVDVKCCTKTAPCANITNSTSAV